MSVTQVTTTNATTVTLVTLVPAANVTNVTASPFSGNATTTIPDWTLSLCGIGASLSILGAIAIFSSFVKLPEIRNFTRRLLTYLTVADFLSAIGYLVGLARYAALVQHANTPPGRDKLCIAQSFSIIFSNLASYLWTIVIAYHIFISYMCETDATSKKIPHIFYHITCWGVPAIVAITAASCDVLGEDNSITPTPWCFLRADMGHEKMVVWAFGVAVAWELFTYLTTTLLYLSLKCQMVLRSRRFRIEPTAVGLRPEDRNYVCVWLVLYILKIWGTARVFIVTEHPEVVETHNDILFSLLNIQCLFTSAQAFANFILFCILDGVVRKHLFRCSADGEEMEPLLNTNV